MKAYLMFRNTNDSKAVSEVYRSDVLMRDLEMRHIIAAMDGKDKLINAVCTRVIASPLHRTEDILYRQSILLDALNQPEAVRKLYHICSETDKRKHGFWGGLECAYLTSTYSTAIDYMECYLWGLQEFRHVADQYKDCFFSEGFGNLFQMLEQELSDSYLAEAKQLISELKTKDGMLISAEMGDYLQGVNYVLRCREKHILNWDWASTPSYRLNERDDKGAKDLQHREELAINEAANALAQSASHLENFFTMLQTELAFYVGCLNLWDQIAADNMPYCIPQIKQAGSRDRSWDNLYDLSLLLLKERDITANTCQAEEKSLYIITGANQGGKTTFLRSIGQAQVMAQCGMFVGAAKMEVPVRCGIFSHFKKEEDSTVKSGKLDEELQRMSDIANHLEPDSMILFNESFSATNEREGSEISKQITDALIRSKDEIFFVTHLYTYAAGYKDHAEALFLKAQRKGNGTRTYHIMPGVPDKTAFGEDLYDKIFIKTSDSKLPVDNLRQDELK